MHTTEELQYQLKDAINASENIVTCLQAGDFERAKSLDLERAGFIRALSRCRNLDEMIPELSEDLTKLSQLNNSIISLSHSLYDDVLTDMRVSQSNRLSHEQYLYNQKLFVSA